MYQLTIFKSQFDNKTYRRIEIQTWDQFKDFLFKLSQAPKKGKKDAELISPAVYTDGTTRANKNVLYWANWAAVDVDDYVFEGDLENVLRSRFGKYNFVCYSTASSTDALPKFRLVFDLGRPVIAEDIRGFWHALNKELGEIGDSQTKDLSRMYYIPADYVDANNFFFSNNGDCLDVDALMAAHPYDNRQHSTSFLDRLPDELKEQVLLYKKNKLNNHDYKWSGYRDCPFWPKDLAGEYLTISDTGWYSKMYAIMVKVAGNATYRGYPISSAQIAELCKQFDAENGNWYENRPLETEADRALEYIYRNGTL